MEASGHARWFKRLPAELNFKLWMGDAAKIAVGDFERQKTDEQDAQHILKLMVKYDLPKIWAFDFWHEDSLFSWEFPHRRL